MAAPKRILAVGGGFASVKLARQLAHDDHFQVTLIAPQDHLEYHGALYRSATGHSPVEVYLPYHEIFAGAPNVTLVNDFVTYLRPQTNEVKGLSGRTYGYDAVAFGIGAEVEYFGIRGMREHAEALYTIHDAIKLRRALRDAFLKHAGHEVPVVLVGGGPNGVELAGDITTFAGIVARQYGVTAAVPRVTVVDMMDRVLPMFLPKASALAAKRMAKLGIELKLGQVVDHATSRHVTLKSGTVLPSAVTVWTAGSRANPLFERYPDLFSLDRRKRALVGEYLQANSPDVYVMGDGASTPFSGLAQTAISDAVQLAANFKRFVRNETLKPYQARQPIFVVPCGPDWAVAQVDGAVTSGANGWTIRREADWMVLAHFLSKERTRAHWERALAVATV